LVIIRNSKHSVGNNLNELLSKKVWLQSIKLNQ
jgi:hypothetical protein